MLETYELKAKDRTMSDKSPCNQIWPTFQREYQSCKEGQRVRKVAQNAKRKSRDFTNTFFLETQQKQILIRLRSIVAK